MPKPEQTLIPGTEGPKIPEIDKAANRYSSLRDERMSTLDKEIKAKAALTELMLSHSKELGHDDEGALLYRYGDQVVIVSDQWQVKVKSVVEDGKDKG